MVEKKTTRFEAVGEGTLHCLSDIFSGLIRQHPDLSPIFSNDLSTPGGNELSGENT